MKNQLQIEETTLNNGLKVITSDSYIPTGDITIYSRANGGPTYELTSELGISHFSEHLALHGSNLGETKDDVTSRLELLIGKRNVTNYLLETDQDRVEFALRGAYNDTDDILKLLYEILYKTPDFLTREKVERERQVIIGEINRRKDFPFYVAGDWFRKKLYDGIDGMSTCALGKTETVKSFTRKEIVEHYRKMFAPSNMTMSIVSEKNLDPIIDKITDLFPSTTSKPLSIFYKKQPTNTYKEIKISEHTNVNYLIIGRLVPPFSHEDGCALDVLSSVLSRKVYDEIRNKRSLSYQTGAVYRHGNGVFDGFIYTYASCDPRKWVEAEKTMEEIISNFGEGNIPDKFIEEELLKLKKTVKQNRILDLNTAGLISEFNYYKTPVGINDYTSDLEKLTTKKIKNTAKKYMRTDDLTKIIMGNI